MGRLALLALAAAKLAIYSIWVWRDDRFIWAVADTGSAFALVALAHLLAWRRPGSRWIVAGVAVSIVAAAVQASGVDLHQHFNHNDVYHLVQLGALLLYYRGVRVLADLR